MFDPTYGTNVHAAYAMGLTPAGGSLPAGEVYVGGTVAGLGGWAGMGVARFTRDGQLDTTFGGGTGTPGLAVYQTFANNDTANALAVRPDGKVVLGGYTNGAETVARFTAAGTLDASFDAAGATPGVLRLAGEGYGGNYGRAVALQPDGKVLLTGTGSVGTGFEALRLDADGTLDGTFGSGGRVAIDVGAASSDPSDAYGAEGDGVDAGGVPWQDGQGGAADASGDPAAVAVGSDDRAVLVSMTWAPWPACTTGGTRTSRWSG